MLLSDGTLLALLFLRNRFPSVTLGKVAGMVANVVMLALASGVLVVPVLWVLRPVRMVSHRHCLPTDGGDSRSHPAAAENHDRHDV